MKTQLENSVRSGIKRVALHSVRFRAPTYSWRSAASSGRREVQSLLVGVEDVAGVRGIGEVCPLPTSYAGSLPAAIRAALEFLAPLLIGQSSLGVPALMRRLDEALPGHAEAKSALDMACWDLMGKQLGVPCHALLGGQVERASRCSELVGIDEPVRMAERLVQLRGGGTTAFQVKLGREPQADIERIRAVMAVLAPGERLIFDANKGWTQAGTRQVLRVLNEAAGGHDVWLEQPAPSYEECRELRADARVPLILDEVLHGEAELARALADGVADGVVIKLSHVGGVSRAWSLLQQCRWRGVAVRLEDASGTQPTLAAVAHLAATLRPRELLCTYSFPDRLAFSTAASDSSVENGRTIAGDAPGFGCTIDWDALGSPIATYG